VIVQPSIEGTPAHAHKGHTQHELHCISMGKGRFTMQPAACNNTVRTFMITIRHALKAFYSII
jgi:hypothetical protein